MKPITEYFPKNKQPRDVQIKALQEVERVWAKSDVIVLNLSVGSGKSLIAETVARYASSVYKMKTPILVPNKILNDQYIKSSPSLHTLKSKDSYTCVTNREDPSAGYHKPTSCKDFYDINKFHCKECPYMKAKRKSYAVPYGVYNFHVYMANGLKPDGLIIDEAHTLLPFIKELNSKKAWQHIVKYPTNLTNYNQLYRWLQSRIASGEKIGGTLTELLAELEGNGVPRYVVERGEDLYRGETRECLKLLPVDTSEAPPILWPGRVRKIVLLSSTIGKKDIEQLGLSTKRVAYIEADNPIPAAQRPIFYDPLGNFAYKYQEENLPVLVKFIEEQAQVLEGKGLIHAPYALLEKLQRLLPRNDRFLFHTRENKMATYEQFKKAPRESQLMLFASGMEEGIDLPYEESQWQFIVKVPYPSLAEPAIQYKAEQDPEWYAWETIKKLIQASGRVCRAPDDYGETIILDKSFETLYKKYSYLFPRWWKDALKGI